MTQLPEPVRRKWLRLALLIGLACASLFLAWKVRDADFSSVEQLTAIAGTFAGLWSLGAAVFQLLPAPAPPRGAGEVADQLAANVRGQWTEEATARRLREPRVIPLSWATTARQVAAPAETVFGARSGRVLRVSLEGRLEGDFSAAAARLAHGYRRIPGGRLVVLGEPGGGKTVLALMLTLGLLSHRTPQSPVPVLLSISSWDPVSESLDDWIVGTLAAEYYGGQTHAPRLLLRRQMLLPVLDGLDEIPESARRNAVRGLNEACDDGRGLVLTCRSAEYQDVIEGGSPALRRAPVVEVAPVSVGDAIAYLAEVDWPDGVDWAPVNAHLREHPEGAAAAALSTPLALSLARAVYQHRDRDPAELLDFDGRHAVEDHLVDHIIPAAYAPSPRPLTGQADGGRQHQAQQAETYLTFLATYLHRHRERDLAWWRMSGRLFPRWAGLVVGLGLGLFTMLLVAVVQRAVEGGPEAEWAVVFGLGVAVLAMLTWYAAPDRPPGGVSFALRGSLHRLRGGFRTGVALTSLPAVAVLGAIAAVTTYNGSWTPAELADFLRTAVIAAGVALAIGVAFAVHQWIATPPERSVRATPMGLLHQDRNSSLVGAGLAGVTFGVTAVPLMVAVVSLAFVVFLALTGWSGEPRFTDILAQVTGDLGAYASLPHLLAATMLPGAAFAVLTLLHRAWPRFALLRVFLAARGQLPWSLARFLSDARDRQLLRQSGGTYQFRHIRLQERLAGRSLARDRVPVPRAQHVRRRRTQLAALGAVLATGCFLGSTLMPHDPSRLTLATGDVEAMSFGPQGTHTLVTADKKGVVQRWNTRTGRKIGEWKIGGLYEYKDQIDEEAELPEIAITAGRDKALMLAYDREYDAAVWHIPWKRSRSVTKKEYSKGSSLLLDISARGRYQLEGNPEFLSLTDLRTGELVADFSQRDYKTGAMSDNGTVVASTGEGGDVYKNALEPDTTTHQCKIPTGARWAIDGHGKRFASATESTAYVWNADCGEYRSFGIHKPADALALDGEGEELALTVDGMTRVYDTSRLG